VEIAMAMNSQAIAARKILFRAGTRKCGDMLRFYLNKILVAIFPHWSHKRIRLPPD
jgi:hypothetical protein